jgi:hypothetical protein
MQDCTPQSSKGFEQAATKTQVNEYCFVDAEHHNQFGLRSKQRL